MLMIEGYLRRTLRGKAISTEPRFRSFHSASGSNQSVLRLNNYVKSKYEIKNKCSKKYLLLKIVYDMIHIQNKRSVYMG